MEGLRARWPVLIDVSVLRVASFLSSDLVLLSDQDPL